MYLQEGKMQFLKDKQTLQDETGETRLGKAIARIMKSEKLNILKSDDTMALQKEKLVK